MKIFKQLLLIILPLAILGCKTTETISKNDAFPEMYNDLLDSILEKYVNIYDGENLDETYMKKTLEEFIMKKKKIIYDNIEKKFNTNSIYKIVEINIK